MDEYKIIELLKANPGQTYSEIKQKTNNLQSLDKILKSLIDQRKITKVSFNNEDLYYIVGKTDEELRSIQHIRAQEASNTKNSNIAIYIIMACIMAFFMFTEAGMFALYLIILVAIAYIIFCAIF